MAKKRIKAYNRDVWKLINDVIIEVSETHLVQFNKQTKGKSSDKNSITQAQFFKKMEEDVNNKSSSTQYTINSTSFYKTVYKECEQAIYESIEVSVYTLETLDILCFFLHEKAYKSIYNIYDNNIIDDFDPDYYTQPEQIEYPFPNPSFPASPTIPIKIEGLERVYLKDESYNITGTHKDRMAWEVFLYIQKLREDAIKLHKNPISIVRLSIISSGSAALAIYNVLEKMGLHFILNILLDSSHIKKEYIDILKTIDPYRIRVYDTDLSSKKLSSEEILEITKNIGGIDLTFGEDIADIYENYYDWLNFEILNQSPDYCFIPFGSGDLYKGILNRSVAEIKADPVSKRYFGNKEILKRCHFIGATTSIKSSLCDKLYTPSKFHPSKKIKPLIKKHKDNKYCGHLSNIYDVSDEYIRKAMDIAKQQNIHCEPSGIAGLALLLEFLEKDKKIEEKINAINIQIRNAPIEDRKTFKNQKEELKKQILIDKTQKILIVNTGKAKIENFQT